MVRNIVQVAMQQRIAWSCAILVALFLTLFGRAPVIPVLAGCVLAVGIAVLRAWPAVARRGNR